MCRFDGRVVANLPFTPISLIQGISHRNLPGEDYTHCSFIFLYILCTMSIRQVRGLGWGKGGGEVWGSMLTHSTVTWVSLCCIQFQ